MAEFWKGINIDIEIDAKEWFDEAYDHERKEMYGLCKKYFVEEYSISEQEFRNKLDELAKRYLSLSPEEISVILSL